MSDGLLLTLQAMRRHLAAMLHDLYLIRLIHHQTRRAFPGERLWNATQLLHPAAGRFLRGRNREGCDIYIQPFTDNQNPGYIPVDLDHTGTNIIPQMRANGHAPCVVLQTLRVICRCGAYQHYTSATAASSIGKQLAQRYGGDLAGTDWRHLGHLAGFSISNHSVATCTATPPGSRSCMRRPAGPRKARSCGSRPKLCGLSRVAAADTEIEAASRRPFRSMPIGCVDCRSAQRFPHTDWRIADKWIAKELLRQGSLYRRCRCHSARRQSRFSAPTPLPAIPRCGNWPGLPRKFRSLWELARGLVRIVVAISSRTLLSTSTPRQKLKPERKLDIADITGVFSGAGRILALMP
jgi:hypothetical protein